MTSPGGRVVDGLGLAAVAVHPLAPYKVADFVALLGRLHPIPLRDTLVNLVSVKRNASPQSSFLSASVRVLIAPVIYSSPPRAEFCCSRPRGAMLRIYENAQTFCRVV